MVVAEQAHDECNPIQAASRQPVQCERTAGRRAGPAAGRPAVCEVVCLGCGMVLRVRMLMARPKGGA